ncbi:MAG: hypothetical protein Kow00104_19460 [Rhodothalassiaceae bacterium]
MRHVVVDASHLPPKVMSQIMDMATQGFVVHRGGPPLFVNRALLDLIGITENDRQVTRPILEWVHPEDRAAVSGNLSQRLKGRPADEEQQFRLIRADGGDLWVHCRATPVAWSDGPAILATLIDVTRLKHSERAQERSEALFRRVFQATPDMVSLSWLESGVFLDVNENLARAIGMDRRRIMGSSIYDLKTWVDPHMPMRIRAAIRKHGSIKQMDGSIRRLDGSVFPVSFSAETLTVDDEEVLLIIARDVSEERAREEELRKSRDAAELANRAKSEFLANMSHELRTPLNAILGFSEIIRGEVLGPLGDARYREYAADIHRSGSHLLEIINDILDLSKVEAGRLQIYPSEIDVQEVAEQCLRLVTERAQQAGLALELKVVPERFHFHADRRLFKQILLNLVTNSIKFTPAPGRVGISIARREDGGLILVIEDTGIGMDDGEIARALTPFGQVDSALTRRHEGTGLGLPLVAAFVAAHQGTLDIQSEKGRGTRVTATFPFQPL